MAICFNCTLCIVVMRSDFLFIIKKDTLLLLAFDVIAWALGITLSRRIAFYVFI